MSITTEGKPIAEGSADGSTSHGDEHNVGLKIYCACRDTTA